MRHQQEKLDLFLNESITAEEFEKDLEVEAERSKVTGEGMVEDAFGTQMSEMEVDDAGEDKVVAEDKGTKEQREEGNGCHLCPPNSQGSELVHQRPSPQSPQS